MIVTLERGDHRPKEHQQHVDACSLYPKIAVAYSQIVIVTIGAQQVLQEFVPRLVRNGVSFPTQNARFINIWRSEGRRTLKKNVMPHVQVLKPGPVVYSVCNGYSCWIRPSVVDLWLDLRGRTREIHPDWDLNAPGLRETEHEGGFSPFLGSIKGHVS